MEESARYISQEGDVKPGVSRRVIVAKPNAGQDWSVAVPGGVWWRVLAVRAQLVTSGAVANRSPRITVGDGNAGYWSADPAAVQAAGATVIYQWWAGSPAVIGGAGTAIQTLPFPLLFLEQGSTLTVATAAIDAADQWSGIILAVEERYTTTVELQERADAHERAREEVSAILAAEGPQIALPAIPA